MKRIRAYWGLTAVFTVLLAMAMVLVGRAGPVMAGGLVQFVNTSQYEAKVTVYSMSRACLVPPAGACTNGFCTCSQSSSETAVIPKLENGALIIPGAYEASYAVIELNGSMLKDCIAGMFLSITGQVCGTTTGGAWKIFWTNKSIVV